jgi:hypothetical protein
VIYALQRFSGPPLENGHKAGFFLGDGAGVGKGRQISALIKEMWRKGTRRILWLSHCKDLREDARRDMVDCGITVPSCSRDPKRVTKEVKIDVWPDGNKAVPTLKGKVEAHFSEGVFFATYQLLVAGARAQAKKKYVRCAHLCLASLECGSLQTVKKCAEISASLCAEVIVLVVVSLVKSIGMVSHRLWLSRSLEPASCKFLNGSGYAVKAYAVQPVCLVMSSHAPVVDTSCLAPIPEL